MSKVETVNGVEIKKEKRYKWNVFSIITLTVLLIYTISFLTPLFWGFMTSLKSNYQFATMHEVIELPKVEYFMRDRDLINFVTPNLFANYVVALKYMQITVNKNYFIGLSLTDKVDIKVQAGLFDFILNTLLYAGGVAFCSTFWTMVMGYMCSKYKFKFSGFIYALVLVVMVLPISGTEAARVTMLRRLRIYNTWPGIWLMGSGWAGMYFLIFYGFFDGLSNTYNEAAEIDGASQLSVMFRICVPLSSKMISTIILIVFVAYWNDYMTPLMYIPTHPTLSYAIYHLMYFESSSIREGPGLQYSVRKIATLMILCVPMLVLFIFLKNKLMGNISIGGIKE